MPIRSQEWRIDRACRLRDAILEEVAEFELLYRPISAELHAMERLMLEHEQACRAYQRGEREAPSSQARLQPTKDEIEQARLDLEADKREPTSEEVAQKHARWRWVWVRGLAAIVGFQRQQEGARGEERLWADSVVRTMVNKLAHLRRSLQSQHPGMPPTDDIQMAEIISALQPGDINEDGDSGDQNAEEDASSLRAWPAVIRC